MSLLSSCGCQFGNNLGECKFGADEFFKEDHLNVLDRTKAFRDAYCTPCLAAKNIEAMKDLTREVIDVQYELKNLRDAYTDSR